MPLETHSMMQLGTYLNGRRRPAFAHPMHKDGLHWSALESQKDAWTSTGRT